MNEDKATRYHRLRRRAALFSLITSFSMLLFLIGSGSNEIMRDIAQDFAAAAPSFIRAIAAACLAAIALIVLHETLMLGPRLYIVNLERRYGLTTVSLGASVVDHLKAMFFTLIVASPVVASVYITMRSWSSLWWLFTGILCSLVMGGVMRIAPAVLLPRHTPFVPVNRQVLCQRLKDLSKRAGTTTLGVYELRVGGRNRRANATVTGFGDTCSIFLSDTLIQNYSDDEIEVVIAHEMAHHLHGHIWFSLVCDSLVLLAGCFNASLVLPIFVKHFGLQGIDDVSGLPLIVLVVGLTVLAGQPIINLISRYQERLADRKALEMTRKPAAFVSALRRLCVQNLAEYRPSWLNEVLFHTHPSVAQRISEAQRWAKLEG